MSRKPRIEKKYKVTNHFLVSQEETIQNFRDNYIKIISCCYTNGTLYISGTNKWKENQIAIGK